MTIDLPYIDEHTLRIDAPRDRVWRALKRYVEAMLRANEHNRLLAPLGLRPRAGFAVAESLELQRIILVGRHRFSRHRLVFELTDVSTGATCVHARTYAAFPGPHGRIYRGLVIGTRMHVVATNYLLREIRTAAAAG